MLKKSIQAVNNTIIFSISLLLTNFTIIVIIMLKLNGYLIINKQILSLQKYIFNLFLILFVSHVIVKISPNSWIYC